MFENRENARFVEYFSKTEFWVKFGFFLYSSIFTTKSHMKHVIYPHFALSNCLNWFAFVQFQQFTHATIEIIENSILEERKKKHSILILLSAQTQPFNVEKKRLPT